MNGKIIFVGLHNKPGMKPLDSKSKSGKLIDRVIYKLREKQYWKGHEIIKTNLFDVDYVPKESDRHNLAFDWIERVELYQKDIVVLLGQMVHENFPNKIPVRVLKVAHPASKRSHKEMDEYVEKVFESVYKTITQTP